MSDKALGIIEQRDVDFYGDELTAARGSDGQIYVSIRQMCASLGIDDNGQRQRMRRQPGLSAGLGVCKLHSPGEVVNSIIDRNNVVAGRGSWRNAYKLSYSCHTNTIIAKAN